MFNASYLGGKRGIQIAFLYCISKEAEKTLISYFLF